MAISAGKYIYKGYDILFWLNPKSLKATIWKSNSLILVKRFWVRGNDYPRLKKKVIDFIDGDNSTVSRLS